MYSDIKCENRGYAVWITLNRPTELNALNEQVIREIGEALSVAVSDDQIRCVVLTGAGRAFCAGADLKFVHQVPAEARAQATTHFLSQATGLMSRIEAAPKPVLAAINGIATGGGLELVLACDLVIAADTARLGDGHSNFGLLPGAGASARLPRRIGMSHAKRLLFTGDLYAAADPIFSQFINHVVPAEHLIETVDQLVGKLAEKSPLGLRRMKELANRSMELELEEALRLELEINDAYVSTHDRNEGLAAFAERRKPRFRGC